ncbi:hypothetical protein CSKR_200693 [Clonorchis sinensis]|uniref:Uncharacterized protein n=1 Tax=Clonorchis sinensis TaxID=79923 RepID=A0A8T1MFK1_CLOSI|nr:hypothetical protein CSKR_200693 [Clonorchis sinensis]
MQNIIAVGLHKQSPKRGKFWTKTEQDPTAVLFDVTFLSIFVGPVSAVVGLLNSHGASDVTLHIAQFSHNCKIQIQWRILWSATRLILVFTMKSETKILKGVVR